MLEILEKDVLKGSDDVTVGLSTAEAKRRIAINGANKLYDKKKKSGIKIFANQFKDFMVMILLFSTVISALLGEFWDALTIIIIVVLNAVLGFIQEFRTEHTIEALEKMTTPTAKVFRDGKLCVISCEEIAEGDVFEVEEGDRIPCDGYILSCKNFKCDESILTGEAESVEKFARFKENEYENLNLQYMAYMGTICVKGKARCVCTAVGLRTQMGKISNLLGEIEEEQTPLQKKLGELGKFLGIICLGVCVVVFLAGVLRGEDVFEMLMTGITVAIAAIPEGLPATVTIALALAVRKMLKKNALVKRLHSVETLGCATVICSDKTGTITENKMTVRKIFTGRKVFELSGGGFDKSGDLTLNKRAVRGDEFESVQQLCECFAVCNNARIYSEESEERNRSFKSVFQGVGDPTEIALLVAAAKIFKNGETNGFERIDEIPFDSAKRCMTVVAKDRQGRKISFSKGALDVIFGECEYVLTESGKVKINKEIAVEIRKWGDRFASDGLRVLGFSKTEGDEKVFLGLCGMCDALRSGVKEAVEICEKAKIRTVMITGDHKLTAMAIGKQAGIFKKNDLCVTGEELGKMSDGELSEKLDRISVFARISPDHKLRIVKAFKKKGHIVAMTGDGVNDAPAIKEADIGVSMSIGGTDVSKQASDVILLDDNFSTLAVAVEQGRVIYANIRKFVRYLISCNIGEVLTMFGGMLMGLPIVLLPTQILLVNLATDGLPAVALGLEPAEKNIMEKPPRKSTDSFFSNGLLSRIIFRGIAIGLFTILAFILGQRFGGVATARTMALFTLVASQLIHVFECKSEEKNLFSVNLLSNPSLVLAVAASVICLLGAIYVPIFQGIFSTVSLGAKELSAALGCALAVPILSCIFHRK